MVKAGEVQELLTMTSDIVTNEGFYQYGFAPARVLDLEVVEIDVKGGIAYIYTEDET